MAEKWDGKGKPPSREAAIEWVMERTGLPRWAVKDGVIPKTGTLTFVGERARTVVEEAEKDRAENEGKSWWERNVADRMPSFDIADVDLLNRSGRRSLKGGQGDHTRQREAEAGGAKRSSDKPVTAEEFSSALSSDDPDSALDALGITLPGQADDSRGAPLWPYEGSAETLAGIKVRNQSGLGGRPADEGYQASQRGRDAGRIGARYYERDTVLPLKWSPEKRAALQRDLHAIGLYGDEKVRLGSWSARDQEVFAELLANANVEGLDWHDLLKKWKRQPPLDIIDRIRTAGKGPRPVVQVTDARDILRTSSAVSQDLMGRVDRSFVDSTVPGVQGAEAASQNAAYDAPAGATVSAAPSPAAFAEYQLRKEKPIEVDGYQFLTQFQTFMQMLGVPS